MYIIGGGDRATRRQISIVNKCQLKKIGELSFDHYKGGCAQRNNEKVFLCFSSFAFSAKDCYESNGPLATFEKLPSSTYSHRYTHIAVTEGKTC